MSNKQPHENNDKQSGASSGETKINADNFDIIDDTLDNGDESQHHVTKPRSDYANHWLVAVIDDDNDVHTSTEFALKGVEILGRPIKLLHAYTADEGYNIITLHESVAVALVDVVMETEDAGLKLVQRIRQAELDMIRLVLRTGQPGYAPEQEVLRKYDINDYRTKAELTRSRLLSVLITAIRSYQQLCLINNIRTGLELVVNSIPELFSLKTLVMFSRGVLTQVASLLNAPADGLVCIANNTTDQAVAPEHFRIVSEAGRFSGFSGKTLKDLNDNRILRALEISLKEGREIISDGYLVLNFKSNGQHRQMFVYLDFAPLPEEADLALLKVFSSNIAVTFENVQLIEKLDNLAYLDPTLNLPNSNAFERELNNDLIACSNPTVVLIEISNVDALISTYGNDITLQYLDKVACQIRYACDASIFLARIGDSTFGVLLEVQNPDMDSIHARIVEPINLDKTTFPVTATTAVLPVGSKHTDAREIVRSLKAALIHAKESHRGGLYYYEESFLHGVVERTKLLAALGPAIKNEQGLDIHLQPKININTGKIIGAEALARWQLNGDPISPATFIPLLDSSESVRPFRDWLLRRVSAWHKDREQQQLPILQIAINLSVPDMHKEHFLDSLMATLKAENLTPDKVQFEITENTMIDNPEQVIADFKAIQRAGYQIAVDDFGTGYSSLSYLQTLPINILKIDRCFVESLDLKNAERSIAASTIALAKALNLDIVAEGIETLEQHEALKSLGCDVCQGFLYARPVPASEFHATYANWRLPKKLRS